MTNAPEIKLIASDLDGTLLPPTKQLPEETFPLIREFAEMGGVFAPASGRQLDNLLKMFAPVKEHIAIIAENGGLVWYKGKIIFHNPMPEKDIRRTIEVIRGESGLYPLISTEDVAYFEDDFPQFVKTLTASYSSYKKVDDLLGATDKVTALKISVWDELPAAEHGGKVLPPKLPALRSIVSGRDWLDVSPVNSNKGVALKALMAHLNVKTEECAAFGDHMNDLEMLQSCKNAYVTANAFPALKEKVGEVVPSNADLGVIIKMKELMGK